MKKDQFTDTVLRRTGLTSDVIKNTEECFVLAQRLLEENRRLDAFLLLVLVYEAAKNKHQVLSNIEKISIGVAKDFLTKNFTEDNRKTYLFNGCHGQWVRFYSRIIEVFVKDPCSILAGNYLMFVQSFTVQETQQQKQHDFAVELKNFWMDILHESPEITLLSMMNQVPEKFVTTEDGQVLITLIIKEFHERSGSKGLIALRVYYLYLGKKYFSKLIEGYCESGGIDLEMEYNLFRETPYWPWYSNHEFKKKYRELTETQWVIDTATLVKMSEDLSLPILVPLIMYAKRKNNTEAYCRLLWYATYFTQTDFPNIGLRLKELNGGYDVSDKVFSLRNQKTSWFTKRSAGCANVVKFNRFEMEDAELNHLKEFYSAQPFNMYLLLALIRIESFNTDPSLRALYSWIINKTSRRATIGKALTEAIIVRNGYALKLLLMRVSLLGYHENILTSIEKVLEKKTDGKTKKDIATILAFYSDIPDEDKNYQRFDILRQEVASFNSDRPFVTFAERQVVEKQRTALEFLKIGDWKSLMGIPDSLEECPLSVLEIVFQGALRFGSTVEVLILYQKLLKQDMRYAHFYSSEMEAYLSN